MAEVPSAIAPSESTLSHLIVCTEVSLRCDVLLKVKIVPILDGGLNEEAVLALPTVARPQYFRWR